MSVRSDTVARISWDVFACLVGAGASMLFIMYIALTGELPGLH